MEHFLPSFQLKHKFVLPFYLTSLQAYKMLQNKADFSLTYETVGLGFGKDVTGKVSRVIFYNSIFADNNFDKRERIFMRY